jgi:hypothetical protein
MEPPWLKGGPGYFARVTGFFDNQIDGRSGDERLSASIEFETDVSHKGLKGRYGFILGRWVGQEWETSGTVHCHIATIPITGASDITRDNCVWAESHAHYEVVES